MDLCSCPYCDHCVGKKKERLEKKRAEEARIEALELEKAREEEKRMRKGKKYGDNYAMYTA